MRGRPSNACFGSPRRIQARWMNALRSSPAYPPCGRLACMPPMNAAPTVALTRGVQMPLLGFGTWQMRGRSAHEAVRYALDVGYRHIDTAYMYGNEAEIGRAVHDSGLDRRDLF